MTFRKANRQRVARTGTDEGGKICTAGQIVNVSREEDNR
jgi:hypothetical protein